MNHVRPPLLPALSEHCFKQSEGPFRTPSKQTLTLKMKDKICKNLNRKIKNSLSIDALVVAEFKNQIIALEDDFGETRFREDHIGANLIPSEAIVLIIGSEMVFCFRCWIAG